MKKLGDTQTIRIFVRIDKEERDKYRKALRGAEMSDDLRNYIRTKIANPTPAP